MVPSPETTSEIPADSAFFGRKYPLYKVRGATHSPAPMTFAAIPWLPITINLLLVIYVIVCLLMILLVLMQRPKQEGLGAAFGGGVTDQMFGARTTNVLQRGTVYLATAFFILSLALAVLIGHKNKQRAIEGTETKASEVQESAPAEESDATDDAAGPKSLIDELPADEQTAPEDGASSAGDSSGPSIEVTPAGEETPDAADPSAPAGDEPEAGDADAAEPEAAGETPAPEQAEPADEAGQPADEAPAETDGGATEEKSGEP